MTLDTAEWEPFWSRLLREFDALCRELDDPLAGAAFADAHAAMAEEDDAD